MFTPRQTTTLLFAIAFTLVAFQFSFARDKGVKSAANTGTPEVQTLHSAYMTLALADHDYDGHRMKAMHALEKACKLLGTDISGDYKDKQPQPTSDDDLRNAQSIIKQVAARSPTSRKTSASTSMQPSPKSTALKKK